MITSSERYFDDFSFGLSNEMFETPLTKNNSHARMHLLQLCMNNEIKGKRITKMKPLYLNS